MNPTRKTAALTTIAATALLLATGCRCVTCDDDDGGGGGGFTPTENAWTDAGFRSTGRITGLTATADELFVFTPEEFTRLDQRDDTLTLTEKRTFLRSTRTLGYIASTPLAFARGIQNTITNEQAVEFQLTQSSSGLVRVPIDSLTPELVALESSGELIGAFNDDSRVYVQPVILRSERILGLMFFSLDYNLDFTAFESVEYVGMVSFPDALEESDILSSIAYLDDHFYVATKKGGYRVSEGGVVQTVVQTSTWVRDFFEYDGNVYAALQAVTPLLESLDGVNFRSTFQQDMDLVDVLGDNIVTQRFQGWPYDVTDDVAERTRPLLLNEDFPTANDLYFGIVRSGQTYYLGIDRSLYKTDELRAAEE